MTRPRGRSCAALLFAVACGSGEAVAPEGSRFAVLGPAVVRDATMGLEWTRRDAGASLDWYKAEAYCRTLAIDGAGGWRLPTIEELRGLYGAAPPVPCGQATCAIDPAFALGGQYVWTSSAPQGPNARTYLDFQYGTELTPSLGPRLLRRVLCVR